MPDEGSPGGGEELPPDATRVIPVVRPDDTRPVVVGRPTGAERARSTPPAGPLTQVSAQHPPHGADDAGVAPPPPAVPAAPPTPGSPGGPRRRRSPARRALLAALVVLALLVGYVGLLLALVLTRIHRVDATPDGERPAAAPGRTYLLVGSDSREDLTAEEQTELGTGSTAGKRTDTILLLHDSASGPTVLVSLPRDSYVPIPGHGRNKLNAAYALGGPELLVETVEDVSGVRIDDYVEIGFGGFFQIVEAVGGVDVCLDDPLQDDKAHIDLPAGCQTLGGADALGYVRARYSDRRGDLGRVERQQEFLRSLAHRASSPAVWANPFRAVPTAMAVGDALTVGEDTGPVDLAFFGRAMLSATGSGGVNLTVPVASTPTLPGVGSVVRWDREQALALFEAISEDRPVPAELLAESS